LSACSWHINQGLKARFAWALARVDITPPSDAVNLAAGKYAHEKLYVCLGVLCIGNIALASVNAELYTAIGLRLKWESPMANTVMVTLANGRADSGYIPNDTAFGALTFQVLGSKLKPGCAETGIVNGLLDLIATTQK